MKQTFEAVPKPVKDRDNLNLLELVCQLHARALAHPSKEMHAAYMEARQEMESRLRPSPSPTEIADALSFGYKEGWAACLEAHGLSKP